MKMKMKMMMLVLGVIVIGGVTGLTEAALLSDDAQTIALWHMDPGYESGAWMLDDDSSNPGRDNDLAYGNSAPVLTTGGGGFDGEAMVFSGTAGTAPYAPDGWTGHDSVQIEMWFKQGDATGAQTLISLGKESIELRLEDGDLDFYPWFTDGSHPKLVRSYDPSGWNHVIATVYNGEMSLDVNGDSTSIACAPALDPTAWDINLGFNSAGTRHYDGLIDEVKVSTVVPEPATLLLLGLGGCLLRKKRA